ncbi:MAG: Uma2 family endonuclease [Chloroflexi bacterium]|nr:Uma2 family endonuclease [Chloroflexota bacterium]
MIAKTREMTVAEYFAFDEASEICNEFIDGEIYPMPGGSGPHNEIAAYAITALSTALANLDCRVYASQMRVRIDPSKYVYPDVSVVLGQPRFEDENEVTLLNPTVVVEVTSPSSMTRDHISKVELYGAVPSIEGYLILDQTRVFAEWYTRAEGGWHLRQFSDAADVIRMEPLGIDLPLAQAYRTIGIID